MTKQNDWYRNEEWDDEIESNFFARLNRARSQRDQYLAIQALSLSESNPEVSIQLTDHYFETRTDCFNDARVFLARAEAHRKLKNVRNAIEAYKAATGKESESRQFPTGSALELVYFIAAEGLDDHYDLAISLFEADTSESIFPVAVFKWNAAMALISHRQGRERKARQYAHGALEAASTRETGLTYHRDLGVVDESFVRTLEELKKIVAKSDFQ